MIHSTTQATAAKSRVVSSLPRCSPLEHRAGAVDARSKAFPAVVGDDDVGGLDIRHQQNREEEEEGGTKNVP